MSLTKPVLSMKDVLCQLCGEVYKEPRMLACLHNFCTDCLVKYQQNSTVENIIVCPQCNIETKLEGPLADTLALNTFIKRNIDEYALLHTELVPSDVHKKVRKFTETCHDTSTEEKESLKTCQQLPEESDSHIENDDDDDDDGGGGGHIPSTEGWSSSSYNSTIDRLHEKYLQLQTKALQITYAIDSVNQSVDDWKENRCRVKDDIQHRSQCLQSLVRQLERKLIAEMENQKHIDEFMKEVTNTKAKLQDTLKLTLHNILFIRQLISDGQNDDIIHLGKTALQIRPSEIYQEINLRLPEYKLELILDKNNQLANEFGELNKSWRKKTLMPLSDESNIEASQEKVILSNNSAELTRSMSTFSGEIPQIRYPQSLNISPSSPLAKRSICRRSMIEGGGIHLMGLTDAEKNIYLKYEDAKKNLEKRRRELAVKHMVGNKSLSQDEFSMAQNEENIQDTALRSSGISRSFKLDRATENKLKRVEELHAGSESNILALSDNWRRSRYDSYKEESGQAPKESGSPIMAARVSMARKKVTAMLSQQQSSSRSNSISPKTSEISFFSGTSNLSKSGSDRSPTTPEKVFVNEQWLETINQEQMMPEDKQERDMFVINAENEHFKPMTRDKFNQVKENVRRKHDRWRSMSAIN